MARAFRAAGLQGIVKLFPEPPRSALTGQRGSGVPDPQLDAYAACLYDRKSLEETTSLRVS
jgi:hypothetical protein